MTSCGAPEVVDLLSGSEEEEGESDAAYAARLQAEFDSESERGAARGHEDGDAILAAQLQEEFNRAAERGEDFSRPFRNDVLDPYYQSGSDPSEPPSAGHSLDSFI